MERRRGWLVRRTPLGRRYAHPVHPVDDDLVTAALTAARARGQDVADVPLAAIAAAAGISRSTLLRRLGGTRAPLDDAVRRAGVDPGGKSVRERALSAAAGVIATRGLGAFTLDAVAAAADCSLPSLHAIFDGRDGLLAAVFRDYGLAPELDALAANPPADLGELVHDIHLAVITAFTREPRVLPAVFADVLSRPDGPASRVMRSQLPAMAGTLRQMLTAQVRAGRLRPLPFPLLVQLLLGPLVAHLLLRPTLQAALGPELPSIEQSSAVFTEAFLSAAATTRPAGQGES